LTVRISDDVRDQLDRLARSTKRSKNYLAAEAIASYVAQNAWQVAIIEKRLAASRSPKAKFIPHDEVREWLESLGTDRPRSRPKGRPRSKL
jgi:predicted transcriptional regulator